MISKAEIHRRANKQLEDIKREIYRRHARGATIEELNAFVDARCKFLEENADLFLGEVDHFETVH